MSIAKSRVGWHIRLWRISFGLGPGLEIIDYLQSKGMVSYASMVHTGGVADIWGKNGGRNEGSGKVSSETCGQ
jgi:hypothetical protein